jgi:hypothetical protein
VIEDNRETRDQLAGAWRAVVKRLLDEGYPASAVFDTMAAVALGDEFIEIERRPEPGETNGSLALPRFLARR